MISNSKIGSRLNLLKGLRSGTGKLSGAKAAIISVSDMSAHFIKADFGVKLPGFYFSLSTLIKLLSFLTSKVGIIVPSSELKRFEH